MLRVTPKARTAITKSLRHKGLNADRAMRIKTAEANPHKVGLTFDKKRETDFVFKNNSGKTILVVRPSLANRLDKMVLDYREMKQKKGLVLTINHPGC